MTFWSEMSVEMRTIGVMMRAMVRAMVLESVPRSDVVGCSES
jgi:hypothetical protein